MTYRHKDSGEIFTGGSIVHAGQRIFNPTSKQLSAAGYEPYTPAPHVPTLDEAKARKLEEIEAYDRSDTVNSFSYGGKDVWLDKATRVGLMNSLACEERCGHSDTVIWLGGMPVSLEIDFAQQLLTSVELYALGCYDRTARHKAAVAALDSVQAVNDYDHTTGYPEKVIIKL